MKIIIFTVIMTLFLPELYSQTQDTIQTPIPQIPVYIMRLAEPDPHSGAIVNLTQSDAISRMIRLSSSITRNAKGFRIQMFSSNRGVTARERAFSIEKELIEKHPNMEVYVTYEAPFWKVRTGNCVDHASAQKLRQWVIAEFPDYAPETYIVPSEIQIIE
jgi:hypothetical protein